MKIGDLVMYDFGDVESEIRLRRNLDVKINQGVVSDILESGNIKATIDYSIKSHISLIDCMGSPNFFAKELSEKEIQNLGAYFLTLPGVLAAKLWDVVGAGVFKNSVELHKCNVDGVAVAARIVEIMASGDDVAGGMIKRYDQAGIVIGSPEKYAVVLWPDSAQEEIKKDLLRVVNEGR